MNIPEMVSAVSQAEETLRSADATATKLARLLRGRLRCVQSASLLADIKRELRDFNIHTGKWK